MSEKPKIILYQYTNCPFCIRVRMKLDSLGLKYKKIEVDPYDKPEIIMNTGGTVPVVDIDGKVISDSKRIIAYLEENFE